MFENEDFKITIDNKTVKNRIKLDADLAGYLAKLFAL